MLKKAAETSLLLTTVMSVCRAAVGSFKLLAASIAIGPFFRC